MDDEEILKEFLFPQNDMRLEKFIKLTTEQQLNSIYIGTIIQQIGEDKYIRLKDGENEIEKDNLKQIYENELIYLKKQMQLNKKKFSEEKNELMDEIKIVKNTIKEDLKEEYDEKYLNTIDSLEDKLLQLQSKAEELRENRLQRELEHHKNILEEKRITEEKLNNQREEYETKLTEYRNKIESLICVTDTSTKKGQEGENWVFNELIRQFKSCKVEDCHTKGHKGDFTVTNGDMKGMFESKNYSKNVPKREIVKFRNDIISNADLKYGVFLSLKSGVVNHKDFSLEFCGGKPVIYLHIVKEEPFKIKIAYDICQLILKNMDCFDVTKEETQRILKEKITLITARHKRLLNKIKDFSNDMSGELNEQWKDFEVFLEHINLSK
tara:strand:+ start:2663 stop:3805 length:1143 start_codon:yes stop_codon:yes gene_type:complete